MLTAPTIRPMTPFDIDAVLTIQSYCYDPSKIESAASFLSKLSASPHTCFIGEIEQQPAGYLFAVAVAERGPLSLHDTAYSAPDKPLALYLHDLAVLPTARGSGLAPALIHKYLGALNESALSCGCLTAVNESSRFWQRYGFQQSTLTGQALRVLAAYGPGAQFMTLEVPRLSSAIA